MKKIALLLSFAILIPFMTTSATPAETAGVAPSPVDFNALKNYLRTREYNHKQYDNGLRSWEFKPYEYKSERLQYRNGDTRKKPQFPGIEYKKLCYHWKNCVKRVYKASNGYDQAYKEYVGPKVIANKGVDLAFKKDNRNVPVATDVRSGAYKLWNWSFITDRNR